MCICNRSLQLLFVRFTFFASTVTTLNWKMEQK
ncbi:hypothetical protein Gotri_017488 [Gossypium trilobum]|uniref:Uncharacterized protein n=1 Tax=Gossypium trilobum TaxID=34281 RepID=A0A7J9E840_9ROSI|nr:hypothetical protein [Gossypium trilobum]